MLFDPQWHSCWRPLRSDAHKRPPPRAPTAISSAVCVPPRRGRRAWAVGRLLRLPARSGRIPAEWCGNRP